MRWASSPRTASTGRCSTSRSPRSAPSSSRSTPRARSATSATCSPTRRPSAWSARTRPQLAKVEAIAEETPRLAARAHVPRPRRSRGPRPRLRGDDPRTRSTRRRTAIDEEDLYTIIYTSGTTGPPKGCMIRHRNYYVMASVVDEMETLMRGDDVMLLYLPLAHNYGKLMLLDGAYVGFTIALARGPAAGGRCPAPGTPDAASRASRACTRRCTPRSSRVSTRPPGSSAASSTGRCRSGAR